MYTIYISIIIILIILFVCWYFKLFPFNEEQFKLEDETCFKTCINTTEQPYIRTSMLEPSSTMFTPTIEIPLAPTKTMTGSIPTPPILNTPSTNINVKSPTNEKNISSLLSDIRKGIQLNPTSPPLVKPIDNSIIPQAPTKTMTGAIPTPPILNTPSTNINIKSPLSESSNPLLDQIRKGFQLKPTSPIQKQETSSNSLLDQIRKGFQLKPTSSVQKKETSSNSLVTPSLQDEIAKRIASRRQYIEDDSDSFDEFFRYRYYN